VVKKAPSAEFQATVRSRLTEIAGIDMGVQFIDSGSVPLVGHLG